MNIVIQVFLYRTDAGEMSLLQWEQKHLGLYISDSHIDGAGLGLFSRKDIKPKTNIGNFWGRYVLTDDPVHMPTPELAICRDRYNKHMHYSFCIFYICVDHS
jgi:hypothetical protein